MKTTILALTMLAATSTAHASELCTNISLLAESTMSARQAGVSAANLMNADYHEMIKPVVHEMVQDAYKTPRYHTEGNQQRAITEFANEWFILCLEQTGG